MLSELNYNCQLERARLQITLEWRQIRGERNELRKDRMLIDRVAGLMDQEERRSNSNFIAVSHKNSCNHHLLFHKIPAL